MGDATYAMSYFVDAAPGGRIVFDLHLGLSGESIRKEPSWK